MDKVSAILWPKGDTHKHRQLLAQNDASAVLKRVDHGRAVLLGVLSFGDAEIAGLQSSYQLSGSSVIGIAQSAVSQILAETRTSGSALYVIPEASLPYVQNYIRSTESVIESVATCDGYVALRASGRASTVVDTGTVESVLIWTITGDETIGIQAGPVLSASFLPANGEWEIGIAANASGRYELYGSAENAMTLECVISGADAVYTLPVKVLDGVTMSVGVSNALSACGASVRAGEVGVLIDSGAKEAYRLFTGGDEPICLLGAGSGVLSLYAVGGCSTSAVADLIDSKVISSARGGECCTEVSSAMRSSVIVAWVPLSQHDQSMVSDMDAVTLQDLERMVIE